MEDQIVSLAQKLISIPSVSSDRKQNEKVLKIIKRELKGFKFREFSKENVKSLLFYTGKKATGKHKLLLNAHLDVVPANPEQFVPKIKGNKLYGRGAYDMKSGAAVLIHTFKSLAKDLPYPLALQIVTDEEIGGRKGTKYQIEKGVTADFVITGENSNLQIDTQSKGVLRLAITAVGTSSHSAYPWLGDNAIIKLIKTIEKVHTIYPIPRKEVYKTTANLTKIDSTNTASNKVPDVARAEFDIRYVPKDDKTIEAKLKKLKSKNVTIEITRKDPPTYTDEKNPYVQKLIQSVKIITGRSPQTISKHGSSDIRFYTAQGIPAVALGPKGNGHHSDTEWVDIKSLKTYEEILKDFLLTL